MLSLDLDEKEQALLVSALESYVSDLRMEIADTDRLDFREKLKEEKAVIVKVIGALRQNTAPGGDL